MSEQDIAEINRQLDEANKQVEEQKKQLEELTAQQTENTEQLQTAESPYAPATAPQQGEAVARFEDVPAAVGFDRGIGPATPSQLAAAEQMQPRPERGPAQAWAAAGQEAMGQRALQDRNIGRPADPWQTGTPPSAPAVPSVMSRFTPESQAYLQGQQPQAPTPGPGQLGAQLAARRRFDLGY
jgi:hypothetical protein